ncbi:MAG: flagellar hook-basal body complex protein FliE [Phycisphaerales bacterium]
MADPLGLIGGSQRAHPGLPLRPGTGVAGGAGTPEGPSFKDVLLKNIQQVSDLQAEAASATEDVLTGKRSDVETVLTATEKADTAFRMLLAVRNKVIAAYDEIKQIRT